MCVNNSLRCDGTQHCGRYDDSDETGCKYMYSHAVVAAGEVIFAIQLDHNGIKCDKYGTF